jgi:hypothetical protein
MDNKVDGEIRVPGPVQYFPLAELRMDCLRLAIDATATLPWDDTLKVAQRLERYILTGETEE